MATFGTFYAARTVTSTGAMIGACTSGHLDLEGARDIPVAFMGDRGRELHVGHDVLTLRRGLLGVESV